MLSEFTYVLIVILVKHKKRGTKVFQSLNRLIFEIYTSVFKKKF